MRQAIRADEDEDDIPDGESSIEEGEGLGPAEDDEDGRGQRRRRDQRAVDPGLCDVPRRRVGERNKLRTQQTSSRGQKRGSTTGQSTLIRGHDLRDELEGLVDQWGNQRSSEAITCETSSRASLPTAMASSIQGLDRRLQPHPPSWPPSWRSGVEDFLSGAAVGFFD